MPSLAHEVILELFRNRPELAPTLLRDVLHASLPAYTSAQVVESTLVDIQPAEFRTDLVVLLRDGIPVFGIVVEAQLQKDDSKRYAWPTYAALLRNRQRCPTGVLVYAGDDAVAEWARRPIELGAGNRFVPWVLSPSGVPIVTDQRQAEEDPELAVLSAMAHGRDADHTLAVQVALVAHLASLGLDDDRANMYLDLVFNSLTETARRALLDMNPAKYEYQSEFAKRYVAEGKAEGRADLLLRQLTLRFGALADDVVQRIRTASVDELDVIGEKVLSATSLQEVLESH